MIRGTHTLFIYQKQQFMYTQTLSHGIFKSEYSFVELINPLKYIHTLTHGYIKNNIPT
jgi:hypothetical protein